MAHAGACMREPLRLPWVVVAAEGCGPSHTEGRAPCMLCMLPWCVHDSSICSTAQQTSLTSAVIHHAPPHASHHIHHRPHHHHHHHHHHQVSTPSAPGGLVSVNSLPASSSPLTCRDPPTRRPVHVLGVPCPCCRGPPPLTLDTVRKNCVTISSIKDEDLLYFSHSNVALSHLPYMVALDR